MASGAGGLAGVTLGSAMAALQVTPVHYLFKPDEQAMVDHFRRMADETGMPIITEVMTPADIDNVGEFTDIFQIGARNSQNYLLLEEVGKAEQAPFARLEAGSSPKTWSKSPSRFRSTAPSPIPCRRSSPASCRSGRE